MRYRRPLRIALVAGLAVAALIAIVLLVGPLLLDLPSVRAQVQRQLSQAVNGQVTWESLEIRVLPSPRGVLSGVRVDLPGNARLRVERAHVYLRLPSLLLGRAKITQVSLAHPDIEVSLGAPGSARELSSFDAIAAYRDAMRSVVDGIGRFPPGATLSIDGGSVDVRAAGVSQLRLHQLALRAHRAVDSADVELTSASDRFDQLHFSAHVALADLSGRVELEVRKLAPQPWLDHVAFEAPWRLAVQSANVRLRAQSDAKTTIQCDIDLDAKALQILRDQRHLEIADVKAKASIVAHEHDIQVRVMALDLGALLPDAAATLTTTPDGQRPQLSLEVPALSVTALRDAALALAGEDTKVAEFAPRMHGGEITELRFASQADTWVELFDVQHIRARARLSHGELSLPSLGQDAKAVSGLVEIADGTVQVTSASAQVGSSRLADTSVRYGVRDRSIVTNAAFDIHAAEGVALARKILASNHRASLNDILAANGRLSGRLHAARADGDWTATIAIAGSNASVRLKQIPWPATLQAVHISASSKHARWSGLRGAIGGTAIEDAAFEMVFGARLILKSASGRARLALGELYPWLRTKPQLADALRGVSSVTGAAKMTLHHLSGELEHPATLRYDLTIEPDALTVAHDSLPAPIGIAGGAVRIDPVAVALDRVSASMLDAKAVVSGSLQDYRSERPRLSATIVDGATGPQGMRWAWQRAALPARLLPRTPMRFDAMRLLFGAERKLDLQAAFQFAGGQSVAAELSWKPDTLDVRRVAIKDRLSDAALGLTAKDRLLHASFAGSLNGRSVSAMLQDGTEHAGVVNGDMKVTLDLDLKGRASAQGKLSARAVDLEWLLAKPVQIEQLELEADGSTLHIRDSVVNWAQQVVTIRGDVKRGARGAVINAQVDSLGIVVDRLLPPAGTASADAPRASPSDQLFPQIWPLLVSGQIDVQSGFIQYQQYRVAPVSATVILEEQRARIDVHDAKLCGLSFPLTMELVPDRLIASAHIAAHNQQLEASARCFTDERVLITGAFDLQADLKTSGRRSELARNLNGTLHGEARGGTVMKFGLLGNILALKSITSLFEHGVPQLGSDAFRYRQLAVRGRFDSGKFVVEESAFDSPAMGLAATGSIDVITRESDLTVLLAPFGTIDRIVRKVPIFGYVVGGTLTSVPIGVSGDIRNPRVVPLGPQAITAELTGMFTRALKLPARLLAPPRVERARE